MNVEVINSIIKGQYKVIDKKTYKIEVRNNVYNVEKLLEDILDSIRKLDGHIELIAKAFDLDIVEIKS